MNTDGGAILYVVGPNNEIHDIILDLDMKIVSDAAGYRCALCEESTLYPNEYALWDAHVFSEIYRWFRSHQNDTMYLRQLHDGGATWVELVKRGEALREFTNRQIVNLDRLQVCVP